MTVIPITDANFETEVMQSALPVLVDFYADWCQPCKRIAPIMIELADEYDGALKVVKVNTEHARGTQAHFGVRSIPTVALIQGGQVVDKIVGARPKSAFVAMVEKVATRPAPRAKVGVWEVNRVKTAAEIGMAVPVDVRDDAAYAAGHLPDAIHLPVASRAAGIAALTVDSFVTYVVYGPEADARATAAAILAAGHNAGILEGGLAAWRAQHLPMA